jgi:hypothetical protein
VDDFETCIQVMTVLQVGLDSEKLNIFTKQGSQKFEWTKVKGPASCSNMVEGTPLF